MGARAGSLRNAGPGAYQTGWGMAYAQYNRGRDASAPEVSCAGAARALCVCQGWGGEGTGGGRGVGGGWGGAAPTRGACR